MLMVMKRLLPAALAVVVVSLSLVRVGLGADRAGVGFKITLGSGKHPVSSEFYSYKQDGPWRDEVTWGNGGHPVSWGKYLFTAAQRISDPGVAKAGMMRLSARVSRRRFGVSRTRAR